MPTISSVAAISRLRRVLIGAAQDLHVAVLDVPPVLAQVDGDAVGAGQFGQRRGGHRVGLADPARLAHGGHMIDVDSQPGHAHFSSFLPPR